MAQDGLCAPGAASGGRLQGIVKYHGGQERRFGIEDAGVLLSLRVLLARDADDIEVEFSGVWATVLSCIEPDDELTVSGAEEIEGPIPGDKVWRLPAICQAGAEVRIARLSGGERLETVLSQQSLEDVAKTVPLWLRPPGSRPSPDGYQYVRFMCTLRPGAEANLYMLVWENARPGPQELGDKTAMNITVVDPSYKALEPSDWTTDCSLPQFSLQLQLRDSGLSRPIAQLPFLCIGDVVRIHRAKVANKPPRFVNIRQQNYSSVVAFQFTGAREIRQVSLARGTPTIGPQDMERVRSLHEFARTRLSNASLCKQYLKKLSECGQQQWQEDVIVCVFEVIPGRRVIRVSDGSVTGTREVVAEDPHLAAEWFFANVRRGHWLKLRAIIARTNDGLIRVSPAMVTRVPEWCFDVKQRLLALQRMHVQAPALDPLHEGLGEAPVVAAAPGIGAQAQQREAPPATYKHHFPTRAGEPPAMVGAGQLEADRARNPKRAQAAAQMSAPEVEEPSRKQARDVAQQVPDVAGELLQIGMLVEIISRHHPEVNGKLARLLKFDGKRGKWVCALEGEKKLLDAKPKSLRPRLAGREDREASRSPRRTA
mmetsp:Transcript_28267/g.62545  ORF Transcript_28267/g.62545 Transcript_28267/m.62545 type:complete len:597 (-) Transcript_28267:135-1925(-)